MKTKFFVAALALTLAGSVTFTSCLGKFALTGKLVSWNKEVTGNKFVNQVIFWAFNIVPVYGVAVLADAIVLNLIEFWSGDNPVAVGETTIQGEKGEYVVKTTEDGYEITDQNGQVTTLVNENDTWSYSVNGGEETKLIQINGDQATVFLSNGTEQQVELSANGVLAFQQALAAQNLAMK